MSRVVWHEFTLSNVFSIKSTQSSIDKIRLNGKKGITPYVTRSDINNGINDFVAEQTEYSADHGNCITVGLDTQTAFYQPIPYYTGQNIQVFRSEHLNSVNAKFILPLLKKSMSIFNWGGNGATLTRLKRSKILLPATKTGEPDWQFMEEYVIFKERNIAMEYLDYLENQKMGINISKDSNVVE